MFRLARRAHVRHIIVVSYDLACVGVRLFFCEEQQRAERCLLFLGVVSERVGILIVFRIRGLRVNSALAFVATCDVCVVPFVVVVNACGCAHEVEVQRVEVVSEGNVF